MSQNVVVPEAQGLARVCARLTGTTTTALPLSITFTPRVLTVQENSPPSSSSELIIFKTFLFSIFLSLLFQLENDFNQMQQTATLNIGETEVCVNVSIVRDNIGESNETFCVDLSSNDSAVQFQRETCQSMVTIIDDISKSTISIVLIMTLSYQQDVSITLLYRQLE